MSAIVGLALIALAAWAFVAAVLALLIFPIPEATAEDRRLAYVVVIGWPIVLAAAVFTGAADDWRRL